MTAKRPIAVTTDAKKMTTFWKSVNRSAQNPAKSRMKMIQPNPMMIDAIDRQRNPG